jgi:hypothetical protein
MLKKEKKYVNNFPENYYFVLYTICVAHLLKGSGNQVFVPNLIT